MDKAFYKKKPVLTDFFIGFLNYLLIDNFFEIFLKKLNINENEEKTLNIIIFFGFMLRDILNLYL